MRARQSDIKGIGLMLAAMMVFAVMDTLSKTLVATYDAPQILLVRFVIFLALMLGFSRRRNPLAALRTRRPGLQIVRSLVLVAEIGVYIVAFRYVPLAEVSVIAAATPLLVIAFAAPVLGETIGPRRWLAVLVGFGGVIVVFRPWFGTFSAALLIPLLGAVLFAVYQLMVRSLAATDDARTTLLYTAVVGVVVLAVVGPFFWRPPDAMGWLLMIAVGLLGTAGHGILVMSLQVAGASVLQPFSYSHVVAATFLGYAVFGDLPDGWTVAGAVLISAGGLLALRGEKLRAAVTPLPPIVR
jgi:drug/metabolite transporter (DMT)-like permease